MKPVLIVVAMFFVAFTYVVWRRPHQDTAAPQVTTATPVAPVSTQKLMRTAWRDTKNGIHISGTIRDRKILSMIVPEYPEWAEVSGVSGNVSAKIWVHPEGNVSSFMQLTQMSTEPRLDELALDALRQWRFAATPAGSEKQSGTVTFRFVLQNERAPAIALASLSRSRR